MVGKVISFKTTGRVKGVAFTKGSKDTSLFVITFVNKSIDVKINTTLFDFMYLTITQKYRNYFFNLKKLKI